MDELREEADRIQADRIQAELAAAEQEWQEWVIVRRRVDTVLAPDGGDTVDTGITPDVRDADASSAIRDAVKPTSQVPMWREGLAWSVLSLDYQRILKALADRARLHQGPLTCQEMAAAFGMDVVPARVEALRSKAKRLVARGWLAEPTPGRFTLAEGVSGPGGASCAASSTSRSSLRAGGAAFKVARQAATEHQTGEGPLHDPPLGQDHEPLLAVGVRRSPTPARVP